MSVTMYCGVNLGGTSTGVPPLVIDGRPAKGLAVLLMSSIPPDSA
jgi:hypothetical protein